LLRVPLNEALELQTTEKQIVLPRLPPELAGFSIVHLSDLHLSGNIPRRFFEEVVEQANDCRPDLVAITGDILDHARCLSWVESTLGRLRAPYGVYYVLGNHDRRAYAEALRRALDAAGWIGLGGRCLRLRIDRAGVILAGSEWPWFGPRPNMPAAVDDESGPRALRILVAHTPDELAWARRNDFDLVLAGHTHGGQIRLPWVGPVVAPSRHGVRYAAGEFYEPPTAMHVSRGLSGDTAFRFLCPPDLTRIVLVAAPKEQPALPCEDMLQSAGCYLEAVAKPGAS
jgi:predicted MPP superfamily phosphohydrolase